MSDKLSAFDDDWELRLIACEVLLKLPRHNRTHAIQVIDFVRAILTDPRPITAVAAGLCSAQPVPLTENIITLRPMESAGG